MTEAQWNQFRRRLTAMAKRMRDDAEAVKQQALNPSGGQGAGELSNVPMHLGDMGTDEFLHDLNATLLENEQYLVDEAVAALDRLDRGTFGKCEECHQEIAMERLKAVPYTRYCTACAVAAQGRPRINLNAGRPRSPRDTFAPEGDFGDNQRPVVQAPSSDRTPAATQPSPEDDVEPEDFQ